MRARTPRHPALRPLIQRLWVSEGRASSHPREWVLPTGSAHLVVRMGAPLRILADGKTTTVGRAVTGGPRDRAYLRELHDAGPSVGAQLFPGAAPLLLRVPAHELEGRHLALSEFWGREVEAFQERLAETPRERWLDSFEAFLLPRIGTGSFDPVVAFALDALGRGADVGAVARATGYSHRHFIERFRRSVGLLPSTYARLLRFQRALRLHADEEGGWAAIAYAAGYADQAHLSREFRRFGGMAPRQYGQRVGEQPNHVPAR